MAKKPEYRQSKGLYKFHNENPKNLLSAADCVIRAIALALEKNWDEVLLDLMTVSLLISDAPTAKKTYKKYLEDLGYEKQKQPRHPDDTKYTTEEFAKENPNGTYIINQANHLTVIVDGYIYDTWDCSDRTVGNY